MRYLRSGLLAMLPIVPVAILQAGGHGHHHSGCCEVQCPRCDHTCKFSVDLDKEAKTCYGSECEPVCIPKVVFPWQKKAACCPSGNACSHGCDSCAGAGCNGRCGSPQCCSVNNGACVRYVNVLKKFEYECDVCKYKWEAIRACQVGVGGPCTPATPVAPAAPADAELPPAPPVTDAANTPSKGVLRYVGF